MLTGLLFSQDVLLHKSGKNYKGTFIGKVDEDIVFKIEGRSNTNKFPINDVDIVITSRGGVKVELYYPFDIPIDIPTKKENPSFGQDGLFLKSGEFYKGRYVKKVDELIVFQVEGDNHFTPFPINDVAIIKTRNGELTYPFDIPTKDLSLQDMLIFKPGDFKKGVRPSTSSVVQFYMDNILYSAGCCLLGILVMLLAAENGAGM